MKTFAVCPVCGLECYRGSLAQAINRERQKERVRILTIVEEEIQRTGIFSDSPRARRDALERVKSRLGVVE